MGIVAKHIRATALKVINAAFTLLLFIGVFLLAAYGSYALWDSHNIYQRAEVAQYTSYKPSAENGGLSFVELQTLNPEVFAWLTVYGTNIDYPVVQGEDNMKYVNTNVEGEYSLSGSIFLDSNNKNDLSDFNSIIYGHHMEQQTMFGELGSFAEESYFEERAYGNLYYEGKDHGLEFFAFIHVDAYHNSILTPAIQGEDAQQAYLENLLQNAMHTRDIEISAEDRIVLLVTCSSTSTNGRDILVARLTETSFDDPFSTTGTNNVATDGEPDIWSTIFTWLPIAALTLIIGILTTLHVHGKKQKRKGQLKQKTGLLGLSFLLLCSLTISPYMAYADPSPVSISFSVEQIFTDPTSAHEPSLFTYTLTASSEKDPLPLDSIDGIYTFMVEGSNTFTLDPISYSQKGIYSYQIEQLVPVEEEGYLYDRRIYNIQVYVQNIDDELETDIVIERDGEKVETIRFENGYSALSEEPLREVSGSDTAATNGPQTGDDSVIDPYKILLAISTFILAACIASRFILRGRKKYSQ